MPDKRVGKCLTSGYLCAFMGITGYKSGIFMYGFKRLTEEWILIFSALKCVWMFVYSTLKVLKKFGIVDKLQARK